MDFVNFRIVFIIYSVLLVLSETENLLIKTHLPVFIDMCKAFDTVSRTGLLYKLSQAGVCKFLYQAIYRKTEYCVLINEYVTSWFSNLDGVKQGDNFSPTLFSVYINDHRTE